MDGVIGMGKEKDKNIDFDVNLGMHMEKNIGTDLDVNVGMNPVMD